ncbi:MAG TPA: 50S ribosomal protein L29 [Candidatus Nanoarchaeia archaeon]|nr:50S ribosomal protein L29 [Candidatus Nanoarchaeia archaeon]
MKIKELRTLNDQAVEAKLLDLKKDLMKINSQIAIGTVPKTPSRVKEIKKTIAQIHTIRKEKEMKEFNAQLEGGSKKE